MKKIGYYLMLFGIGSIILNLYGYEFRVLMWLGEGLGGRILIASIGLLFVAAGIAKGKNK